MPETWIFTNILFLPNVLQTNIISENTTNFSKKRRHRKISKFKLSRIFNFREQVGTKENNILLIPYTGEIALFFNAELLVHFSTKHTYSYFSSCMPPRDLILLKKWWLTYLWCCGLHVGKPLAVEKQTTVSNPKKMKAWH